MLRRALLIVLMLLLPVQWSWAAAASACSHEAEAAHFGHHEHAHCAGDATSADVGPDQQHPDCQTCHGAGVACLDTSPLPAGLVPVASLQGREQSSLPEPPLERLLRPPLRLVA